jgi:hypothetical protein
MSLDVCPHLGEKLADRHTCLLLCYRFPECLPLDEGDQEPDRHDQLTQDPSPQAAPKEIPGSRG